MGRKRRIFSTLLISSAMCGCMTDKTERLEKTALTIGISEYGYGSKAINPNEDFVKDINFLIYNEDGYLEEHAWIEAGKQKGQTSISIELLMHKKYSFYACVNFGREVAPPDLKSLKDLRWHMAYPDEYKEGMAMAGVLEDVLMTGEKMHICIPVKRLMAKISLRIDRSCLSEDVMIDITSVKIGNCPKSAHVFQEGKVRSHDECFASGFTRNEGECSMLNRDRGGKISGSISLYTLENIQEAEGADMADPETFTFIEIKADYSSGKFHTEDRALIYRFYLGDGIGNYAVERNCHYRITVIPEDDGLSGNSWEVDKDGLMENDDEPFFNMSPSGFIQADVGDSIHVRCSYSPESASFDIGLEELEEDAGRGIYEYEIDRDGKGVMITLRKSGQGLIYMSAGAPVNESGLLIIEVNQ